MDGKSKNKYKVAPLIKKINIEKTSGYDHSSVAAAGTGNSIFFYSHILLRVVPSNVKYKLITVDSRFL